MGRLFSILLLFAVMLVPARDVRKTQGHQVFFSMLFPQLIPEWMLGKEVIEL